MNQWTKSLQLYYYRKIYLQLDPIAARSTFLQFQIENQSIDLKGFWRYPKICPFWAVLGVPDWLLLQCLRKPFHLRRVEHRLWHHLNLKNFIKFNNKYEIPWNSILPKIEKNPWISKIHQKSKKFYDEKFHEILKSKIWKLHDEKFHEILKFIENLKFHV